MDHPVEAACKLLACPSADKPRRQIPQMAHHLPKQLFGQDGVALPVGIGQIVARRRRRSSERRERPGVELERITDIVEANAMGQLRITQADHMTPRCEGPSLLIDSRFSRQLGHKMLRNIVAGLAQNGEF